MKQNPFFFSGEISNYKYIPRLDLEEKLLEWVASGVKVRIDGDRRIGKTSLIKSSLKNTPTLFVDLSAVKTEEAVLEAMEGAMHRKNEKRASEVIDKVGRALEGKSIKAGLLGEYSLNIATSKRLGCFTEMEKILDRMNLESKKERACVVFDEFQELLGLPDPNAFLWKLRSITQRHSNLSYFFSGSRRREMIALFADSKAAFYKQTIHFSLQPVERKLIEPWCCALFRKNGKILEAGVFDKIWEITHGKTGDIQKLCHFLFENSAAGKVSESDLKVALRAIFRADHQVNTLLLRGLTAIQQKVLKAYAIVGGRERFNADISRISGVGNGTIKTCLNTFLNKLILFEAEDGEVCFDDPFLCLLLQQDY